MTAYLCLSDDAASRNVATHVYHVVAIVQEFAGFGRCLVTACGREVWRDGELPTEPPPMHTLCRVCAKAGA